MPQVLGSVPLAPSTSQFTEIPFVTENCCVPPAGTVAVMGVMIGVPGLSD